MSVNERFEWFFADLLEFLICRFWKFWLALAVFLVLRDMGSILRWTINFAFGI